VDKLGELQRRAARLTTAVAPADGRQTSCHMSVSLGPPAMQHSNQPPITGQLFVAIKFVPENEKLVMSRMGSNLEGELHVIIKEAHDIGGFEAPSLKLNSAEEKQPPPSGSLPNPFCKCYLLASNGQRVAKQKTPHLKRTANPRWDHKCVFNSVKLDNLTCQAIEILVFNRDSILVSNECLGGIRLCRSSESCEKVAHLPQTGKTTNNQEQISNDSASIGSDQLQQDSSSSSTTLRRSFNQREDLATKRRPTQGWEGDALCSERESRLWNQMLARPNIWVYGELRLRQLRPLVASNKTSGDQGCP